VFRLSRGLKVVLDPFGQGGRGYDVAMSEAEQERAAGETGIPAVPGHRAGTDR
jgi:hypothetical protein